MNVKVVFFMCYIAVGRTEILLDIEHKIGNANFFTNRGTITLSSSGDDFAKYQSSLSWPINEQIEAAKIGASYCIRTKLYVAVATTVASPQYVMSCIPACSLVLSDLSDVITLSFDSNRQRLISIGVQPIYSSTGGCENLLENTVLMDTFNTTVRIVEPVEGPVPETQAYLQKLEREKQEKAQGEQGDNRSFLAKYWMYIVPVLVVVMLSSAMNPEAQQGGR